MPDGTPLAAHHASVLASAGMTETFIVLGAEADRIHAALAPFRLKIITNTAWTTGRLSSLQAGLRAVAPDVTGALVVPVDTVGIKAETIRKVIDAAERGNPIVVRPSFQNQTGRIIWIDRAIFPEILALKSTPEFRLDQWLAHREIIIAVDDAAVINNINTPDAWSTVLSTTKILPSSNPC